MRQAIHQIVVDANVAACNYTLDSSSMSLQKAVLIFGFKPAMNFILLVETCFQSRNQWAKLKYFEGHAISLLFLLCGLFDVGFDELTQFWCFRIGEKL